MVVDQANLNAKQEPFSRVNNWLAADRLFSRATRWVDIKLKRMRVWEGGTLRFQDKNFEVLKLLFISAAVIAGKGTDPQNRTAEQGACS